MICKECNTDNPDGSIFCLQCGAKLKAEEAVDSDKSKKRRALYIFTGLLVFCVFLMMAAKVYFDGSNYTIMAENAKQLRLDGNYDKAEEEYKKAISASPDKSTAYKGLANLYRDMGDFDRCYEILEKGSDMGLSMDMKKKEIEEYEKKYDFLTGMSENIQSGSYDAVYEMLESVTAEEYVPLYMQNGKIVEELADGYGIIFNSSGVYNGDIADGMRDGYGVQVGDYNDSYYYVDGQWEQNLANGRCTLYYNVYTGDPVSNMYIEGNFTDNYMDGDMEMRWKGEDGEYDSGTAHASAGEYESLGQTDDGMLIYVRGDDWYWFTSASGMKDNGIPLVLD